MAVPGITSIEPASGPTSGNDYVRITGTGFGESVLVLFGGVVAAVASVRDSGAGVSICDVHSPAHDAGAVSVELHNLDSSGVPVPGESAVRPFAFTYQRPDLTKESDVTRAVRQLLRDLKQQILQNTSISVSVEYDDTVNEDAAVVAMATLPGIVISGPSIHENRIYSNNELEEEIVKVGDGYELQRRGPSFTADLGFTLTCASERTVEKLNLMSEVVKFFNRKLWLEVDRDPDNPELGTVRWELSPSGDLRTSYRGESQSDSRAFTYGFVVFGVDVDEGVAFDRNAAVEVLQLNVVHGDES